MTKTPLLLILGLSCAGLLCGLTARRMLQDSAISISAPTSAATKSNGDAKSPGTTISNPAKIAPVLTLLPPSTDTVEALLALNDATLYPRLAAWLLGASEPEIAAYWDGYRAVKNRQNHIVDLVFINWTRMNPQGAIAAVAGTKDDFFPWWAWTAHDPQLALATAISTAPKMVDRVARGIGRFQPDWLRANLDQIPEASRSSAFATFKDLGDTEHPLESLKFMQENAMGFDSKLFKNLAQKDPWAALDWLKENPSLQADRYHSNDSPLDVLLETMSHDHPDDLERLVAQTPPGEMKRKMEAAIFDKLLTTDPAAAIAQANATDSKAIAAERFAKIGLSSVRTDPDQAFEMAKALLAINPGGSDTSVRVETPKMHWSMGGSDNGSDELLTALIAKDPARLMQLATESGPNSLNASAFSNIAHKWANQDLVTYTNWVNQQTDPAIRDHAFGPVVNELVQLGQYTEAIEWAQSSKMGEGHLMSVFYQWGRKDPTASAAWVENSDLSPVNKTRFQEIIKKTSQHNHE